MTDIFINGEIGGDSWDGTGEFGIIGTKYIQNQLAESDNEITVHINSPGGEVREGYAIYDLLVNSGKKVNTIIEGTCASIATVPFLAGKNRTITENSKFMIHNPWMMAVGDADALQEDVDRLKETESDLLDFYVKKTSANREDLEQLMAEENELSSAKAEELGFATAVIETIGDLKIPNKIFAKAIYTRKMKNKEPENKTLMAQLEGFLTKVKALIPVKAAKHDDDDDDKNKVSTPKPRAEEQQLEDGTRIFINGDEGNFSGKEVWVIGEDGSLGDPLEDGDHTLGDGRVLRIGGGTITEVVEQMETTEDTNALKAQVTKMQAEISRLKEGAISDGLQKNLMLELNNIRAQITSNGAPINVDGNFTQKVTPKSKREGVFERAHTRWNKNNKPTIKN